MKRKKTVEMICIIVLVVILIVVGLGYRFVHNLLYPEVQKSGSGSKKVLCIGDSITYGQGVLKTRESDSYPAVLADLLGADYQTLNYGLCNRTLLSSGNMPYKNEEFASASLEQDADMIIIMLGSNDSKLEYWNAEQYKAEYIDFIKAYQNMNGRPEVYIMLPPAIFKEPENDGDCNNTVLSEEVIPAIEYVAEQTGAHLIDLYSVTEEHPEWYADGLHPNAEGNRVIAETIYEQIGKGR